MLASSAMLYSTHTLVYESINASLPGYLRVGFDCVHYVLWVLLPVTGWVAESWLGRYRTIAIGLIICTITLLMLQVAFILLNLKWTPIPAFVLAIVSLTFGTCGIGGFYTNLLPFALDQMIGASAEELSAAVQWHSWGFVLSILIRNILPCIFVHLHFQLQDTISVVFLTLGSLSLSVVLIMDCLFHKWLDTHDKAGKPIKLIFEVLNYARKNKYPQLRSAFTYIDEEQPHSRLDFGKHKFGGPFTEEEVENVKTVFRLMPLLVAVAGSALVFNERYDQFSLHAIQSTTLIRSCFDKMQNNVGYITGFILIPVYRFIVYPFIKKYIPSMLKIMGTGIFLCLITTVVKLVVSSVGHFYSNASNCIFDDKTATGTIPIPIYWVFIVEFVNGVSVIVMLCSLYEFVMAQTPNKMRGIMMGLVLTLFGASELGIVLLMKLFLQFQAATPSCVFYYYLVLSLLMLLILVVYVILAKCYKLRERDKHINIHAIVEEHYERYLDQEEEYVREISNKY